MNTSRVFLTESEFEEIFGKEISRVLQVLSKNATHICSLCKGDCCREIGCRLYSEKFSSCPISEIRPRECRFHFCHRIVDATPLSQEYREVLEEPTKDLLKDEQGIGAKLFPLFPQFPLDTEGLRSLGIEEAGSVIRAFENGALDQDQARDILKDLCRNTGK